MWDEIDLSRHVKVGRRAPTEKDFDALHGKGIRSVIDLRSGEEPEAGGLSPEEEAGELAQRGIVYERMPVPLEGIDEATLDAIGETLRKARKPVLVHSGSGKRAGMVALALTCIEAGIPGTEMLEMARNLDLVFGSPQQQHMFATYVDERQERSNRRERREEAVSESENLAPLLPEDVNTVRKEMQEAHHRTHALDRGESFGQVPPPGRPQPSDRDRRMPPSQPYDEKPHDTGAAAPAQPAITPPQQRAVRSFSGLPQPPANEAGKPIPTVPQTAHPSTVRAFPFRRPAPFRAQPHPASVRRPVPVVGEPAEAVSIGTPIGLATAAAAVAGVLLLIDRRLLVPLLFGAGVIAGRAMIARGRQVPLPPELVAADRAEDREVEELERRVKRLSAKA